MTSSAVREEVSLTRFSHKPCYLKIFPMSSRSAMRLNDLSVEPDPNLWDLPPRIFIALRDSLDADNTYERLFEVMPECYSKHLWRRLKIYSYNQRCHSSSADMLLKGLGSQGVRASMFAKWLDQLGLEKILMLLKKDEPLKIIENPSPQKKLVEGDTLQLVCRATSFPSPNYQWFRDDEELLLQQKPELVISNIRKSDFGIYVCRVHKVNSTRGDLSYDFSTPSSVTVIPLSHVAVIPCTSEDRLYQEDDTLSCSTSDISTQEDISSLPINTSIRRITNVAAHCEEEKEELIEIFKQPIAPAAEVRRGSSLILSCEARFKKKFQKFQRECDIQYQWICDGREIPGETDSVLHLNNIVEENGQLKRWYMCKAYYGKCVRMSDPVPIQLKPSDNDKFLAKEKLALLIACDEYEHFESLYSSNDVEALESTLKKMNFNVLAFRNLKCQEMKNAIDMYSKMLRPGSYSLVYYGGHGFELYNQLYLQPVDCGSKCDPQECIPMNYILNCTQQYKPALNVLLLDACRNVSQNIMECDQIIVPPNGNTVIGYATSSSRPAYECHQKKVSIFMKHLLDFLPHDVKVQDVLYSVQHAIKYDPLLAESVQFPYVCSSLNESRTLVDHLKDLDPCHSKFYKTIQWAEKIDASTVFREFHTTRRGGQLDMASWTVILKFYLHKKIYCNGMDVDIYVKIHGNTDPDIFRAMSFGLKFSSEQVNKVMKKKLDSEARNESREIFLVEAFEIQGIQKKKEQLHGELVTTFCNELFSRDPFDVDHPMLDSQWNIES